MSLRPGDEELSHLVNIQPSSRASQCAPVLSVVNVETVKLTGDVLKPPVAVAMLTAAAGPNVHFALATPCSSVAVTMGFIAPPPACTWKTTVTA